MKAKASKFRTVRGALLVVIALALAVPSISHAQGCVDLGEMGAIGINTPVDRGLIECGKPTTPSPCDERGNGGGDPGEPGQGHGGDLCADPVYGGASCVAVGLHLEVEPVPILLPTGAVTQLSRSEAMAFGYGGYGQAHADAHQARADVPGTLGAGVVESECDVSAYSDGHWKFTSSHGRADAVQVALDLMPNYSIPLSVEFDLLCEEGSSNNGAPGPLYDPCVTSPPGNPGPTMFGANRADIANLIVNGAPIVTAAAMPNTHIPIPLGSGLVGDLYLNEQWPGSAAWPGSCVRYDGDALRLVVKSPLTGTIATLIVSWVSTCS